MHLLDPVPEAIEDHPANDRMIRVERISRPAVIGIPRRIPVENIIRAVIEAAETQRWPAMVAFGGMVEDHVENDLDPGAMQCLNHVAELIHRAERVLPRAVCLVRCKERDRRVTPVIDQPGRSILRIELKHRHQFDGSHAELMQIRNFLDQTRKGAPFVFSDTGTRMARKAAHVHLVYDRPGGRPV